MVNIRQYNTFGIDTTAHAVFCYHSEEELLEWLSSPEAELPYIPVGSGSNLLFMKPYEGTLLISGIKHIRQDGELVEAGSGLIWDELVQYCVVHELYGAENLSIIPGTVGASAVQNIGAYGTEAKDLIVAVRAVDVKEKRVVEIPVSEIGYGYRTSQFKRDWSGRYIITAVRYRLSQEKQFNLGYKGLNDIENPTLQMVRDRVISLREGKLPDPKVLGNAGSFFMNPVVSAEKFKELQAQYSDVPHYAVGEDYKIPAAWLIEQCGWKGRDLGPAGVYEKQPLVLVNRGGATGADIVRLAETVQHDVEAKFGIRIHPEAIYV